jgi:CheY-like chemotaxis protein
VVEPEAELRQQLTQALDQYGAEALTAEGARQAFDLLDRYPVGALVIDAQLPTMSGFDFVRSARQHPRGASAPAVIITSVRWTPFQKAAALHQMGLLDLLVKPVDPTHVAELVVGAMSSEPLTGWEQDTQVGGAGPGSAEQEPRDTLVGDRAALFPPEVLDADVPGVDVPDDTRVEGQDRDTQVQGQERTHVDEDPRLAPEDAEPTEVGFDPRNLADPASHSEKRQVERATRAARAGPIALRGNLTRTPFPELLHDLYQRRATGALFLLNDQIKKIVYFSEGHPSYIKSNRLSECLGKVLVREKMITESQCRESLRRMAETTRQQGTVLIEMGVISPHDLVVGLELQLRVKLMDIFSWDRGEYLFRRESKVPADVISLDVSNATLIVDGVRTAWEDSRLEEALAPHVDRYVEPNPDPEMRFQELSLDADEQALLDQVDGTRTLRQILADSPLPARKGRVVAYVLLATAACQLRDAPLASVDAPAPLEEPGEDSLRERLATELVSFRQRDDFGVLGLSSGCTDHDVRGAHARAAREFHPDRFRHLSGETRRMAQELFRMINAAAGRIATAELRESSRRERRQPGQDDPGSSTGEVALEAEETRRQAKRLIRRHKWAEARQLLTVAVGLCPDAGDLRALLGWATYKSDPESAGMVRTAIRELRGAIELEPRKHEAYLYLGRVYAGMGKTILAEKQFEKALQCNPDCNEALDELKIQQKRRPSRRFR